MRQPEHCAGSSSCTLRLGQACSQLLEAWYFPALTRETSTHSTTKQEKPLWDFQTGGRIGSNPIAFSVDGHQLIAISADRVLYVFGL